jgi:hypothetical protein
MPSIPDASCEAHVTDADAPPESQHDSPCSLLGHISFGVEDLARASPFCTAALETGGTDAGAPGLLAHHGPSYYAAFEIDPDGRKPESVQH